MNTQVVAVPSNIALPAHLQTPQAAAEIAAANAAAAGGVRIGGSFPRISIETNKFSIVDGDEVTMLVNPPTAPGQPSLPMMCLEIVAIGFNPAVSKTYFKGKYVKGQEAAQPDCRSSNGVTPDADVPVKQHATCAACPQNAWGSKVSELSGKDIKACDDSKQLAVLPGQDLAFKALGLRIQKGSLKNWGLYVQALTERGYPISGLVTNVTFDAQQTGVLNFSFNRFLTEAESAKVAERQQGADVKLITAQSRVGLAQLPPPTQTAHLPGVALAPPLPFIPPVQPAPQGPQFPPETGTFGAPATPVPAAPPPPPPPPVQADPFAGRPAYIKAAVDGAGGLGTAGGNQAWCLLTMSVLPEGTPIPGAPTPGTVATTPTTGFGVQPLPAAPVPAQPAARKRRTRAEIDADNAAKGIPPAQGSVDLSHVPPEIAATIKIVGADSPAGQALLAQYPATAFVQPGPSAVPTGATGAGSLAPPAPAASGFGTAPTAAPTTVQPVVSSAVGESLRDKLMAKLGKPAGAA